MTCVLTAKLKGRDDPVKITSRSYKELMLFGNTDDAIDYDPRKDLMEGQCYKIENFSNDPCCPRTFKNNQSTFSMLEAGNSDLFGRNSKVAYFVNTDEDGNRYYQKFTPAQFITKRPLLAIWGDLDKTFSIQKKDVVAIRGEADAYYDEASDTLFFRDKELTKTKTFFPDIEEKYREATDEEVGQFLDYKLFLRKNNYNAEKLGIRNRKRVARLIQMLKELPINEYSEYAKSVIPGYMEEGKIIIQDEKGLVRACDVLEENYYRTQINDEIRLALASQQVNENRTQ